MTPGLHAELSRTRQFRRFFFSQSKTSHYEERLSVEEVNRAPALNALYIVASVSILWIYSAVCNKGRQTVQTLTSMQSMQTCDCFTDTSRFMTVEPTKSRERLRREHNVDLYFKGFLMFLSSASARFKDRSSPP